MKEQKQNRMAVEPVGKLMLVWLTFLIAEGISCLLSVLFMRGIRKRKLISTVLSR